LPRQAGKIRGNEIMTCFEALRDCEGNEACCQFDALGSMSGES